MSRVSDLIRKGKKYQSGNRVKFNNNKNGSVGIKGYTSGNGKDRKVGSKINLKGKIK